MTQKADCALRFFESWIGFKVVKTAKPSSLCPCGVGSSYQSCCARFHLGQQVADTALQLMRSRYCAYVYDLTDYLSTTWDPETRPSVIEKTASGLRWIGLDVKAHRQLSENQATVEFVARFKIGGRAHRLHEISEFIRTDGRWRYRGAL
jgi:SEC-C motif domain protein